MSTSIRSQLAPKGLEFHPSDFFISDKYATILTVVSYPKYIVPGYLSSLTNMPGIKVVVKHIPVPFQTMSKMLNRQVADLKEKYQHERDQTMRERYRQDAESLEYFTSMLAGSQARIFDFQMHIMITADTKEDLELKKVNVKNYLDAMELKAISLRFEQEKVLKSILQLCIHLFLIVLKILDFPLYLEWIFLEESFYLINFYIRFVKKITEIMLI